MRVFGYGSLLYEPPEPLAIIERRRAILRGYQRVFNKRSPSRGCRNAEAVQPEGLPGWTEGSKRTSLALGTERAPHTSIEGMIIGWRPDLWPKVLEALDQREGFRPGAPTADHGYLRCRVDVETGQGSVEVWTYVSNPAGRFYVPNLSIETTTEILLHATPRIPSSRAQGANYLARLIEAFRADGLSDPRLENLHETVERIRRSP